MDEGGIGRWRIDVKTRKNTKKIKTNFWTNVVDRKL